MHVCIIRAKYTVTVVLSLFFEEPIFLTFLTILLLQLALRLVFSLLGTVLFWLWGS